VELGHRKRPTGERKKGGRRGKCKLSALVSKSIISSILSCLAYPLLAPFLTPVQRLFLFAPISPTSSSIDYLLSPVINNGGCPDSSFFIFIRDEIDAEVDHLNESIMDLFQVTWFGRRPSRVKTHILLFFQSEKNTSFLSWLPGC
jgi:hypothetical protein